MRELTITVPGRIRPRRLRRTAAMRDLVAETRISSDRFVLPHFVLPAERAEEPVPSMPGISLMGVENLLRQVESDLALGIRSVLLFGHPVKGTKSPGGEAAADDGGAVQQAVSRLKAAFGDSLVVMTDVCLCSYTDHGHCGLIEEGEVDNDSSLRPLVETALSHARAGADVVAPSDMMDGRVAAIRDALDTEGLGTVAVLAYTAKYASAYYGPFRDAADSAPAHGDRQSYQMDCRNGLEAIREAELDEDEGRGHTDGEAGPRLPRRHRRGSLRDHPAPRGLQRVRRVLGGQGRGRQRMAGRSTGRAGEPDGYPPGGRRPHHHLPLPGCAPGEMAVKGEPLGFLRGPGRRSRCRPCPAPSARSVPARPA